MLELEPNKNNRPIAIVNGGPDDGKYVFINSKHKGVDYDNREEYLFSILEEVVHDLQEELYEPEATVIEKALIKNVPPYTDKRLAFIYDKVMERVRQEQSMEFKISEDDEGKFEPVPNYTEKELQMDSIFLSGPRGSGKSTWTAMYCKHYKQFFPENKIYLFSEKDEDPAFEGLEIIRVPFDDKFGENNKPDDYKKYSNSLCIFDDVRSTGKKTTLEADIYKIKDKLLKVGRASGISVIATVHKLLDTRNGFDIANASGVVMFPEFDPHDTAGYLTRYMFLNKKKISEIMNSRSRWVLASKTPPHYLLMEKTAMIVTR